MTKSGFSDLFLPGPACTSNCGGHTIYDPSASSASQDLGETFDIEYGDGSTVSGEQYSDTVSVAGLTVCSDFVLDISCLTVRQATDQTLGVATEYSSSLAVGQFPPDGILGLAFESISAYPASPVFQSLVSDDQATEAAFSFKLATSGSELYLGGANTDLYTGDFSYAPVTNQVSCRSGVSSTITDIDWSGFLGGRDGCHCG